MAQTTTSVDSLAAVVGLSTDGVTFTDVAGSTVSITPGAQARAVGKANTIDGDSPIVKPGKKDVTTITINGLYTPTTQEVFDTLADIWEHSTTHWCYVQWSYTDTGGDPNFTTDKGVLSSFSYPKVDAADPNPVPFQAVVTIGNITRSTIPT